MPCIPFTGPKAYVSESVRSASSVKVSLSQQIKPPRYLLMLLLHPNFPL
jgi:hypothetical protein